MKKYNKSEISKIIQALERYCKVFHTRLDNQYIAGFISDLKLVKTHLDHSTEFEFLTQLSISELLILFSIYRRIYQKVAQTSLFLEIEYLKQLTIKIQIYILEHNSKDLKIEEVNQLQNCI